MNSLLASLMGEGRGGSAPFCDRTRRVTLSSVLRRYAAADHRLATLF